MPETSKSCGKMRDYTKKHFHLDKSAVYNSLAKINLIVLLVFAPDKYYCPCARKVINKTQICDGRVDCECEGWPLGEDEHYHTCIPGPGRTIFDKIL